MESGQLSSILLVAILVLFLGGGVIERRLRRLFHESPPEPEFSAPPRFNLDLSPRQSLNFMRIILTRRHLRHPDVRIRRWGDVLFAWYILFGALLVAFAASISMT